MTAGFPPRLLVPVELKWITKGMDELNRGKKKLYFGTDSNSFLANDMLSVKTILFKIKGDDYVSVSATIIDITDVHPRAEERLDGEACTLYATYYSFAHLTSLTAPIPLSSLRYHNTGNTVPNTVPGCCIVSP